MCRTCVRFDRAKVRQNFYSLAVSDWRLIFACTIRNYLFISIEPTAPRIYLIKRRLRDLEKQSKNPHPFFLLLRKRLSNAVLQKVEKLNNERILRFDFLAQNELGETENLRLIAQLTGRSANLFLLDKNDFILDAARENTGKGQEIGNRYAPPVRDAETRDKEMRRVFPQGDFESLSESSRCALSEKGSGKSFSGESADRLEAN